MEAFYADQNELPSGISPQISKFIVSVPLPPFCRFLIFFLKSVLRF